VGGIGAVGAVTAIVTGIVLLRDKSVADEKCKPVCVDQEGRDAVSTGRTLLPINAVAAGLGIVGLGVGAFLLVTSKSASPAVGVAAGL
jgi:hypothetical protein